MICIEIILALNSFLFPFRTAIRQRINLTINLVQKNNLNRVDPSYEEQQMHNENVFFFVLSWMLEKQ